MSRTGDTTLGTRVAKAAVMSGLFPDGASQVRIGRYVVEHSLGRGSQGEVFLARDTQLRRRVALKMVPITGSPNRALDEARALAQVEHRNVVRVFDVGHHEDCVFLVMALIEGETLASTMRGQRGFTPQLRRIMQQAGEGLAAIHDAGLVHRDFKPTNVLVDRLGCARIADFGLALPSVAADDEIVGTLGYVAPEQLAGEPEPRSDQYSYCVTLFEMIAGRLPHEGATAQELLRDKLRGAPPIPDGTARALSRVLRRGLAPRPEQRFADLRSLQEAMDSSVRWWVVPALPLVAALAAGFGPRAPATNPCSQLDPPAWKSAFLPPEGDTTVALDTINAMGGDYVAAWKQAHTEICQERGDPRAVACLAELATEFTATIETIADRPADASSVSALKRLSSPATCSDTSSTSPRSVLLHAEVRSAVVRSRVLLRTGDDEGACSLAHEAQQLAFEDSPGAWGESEFVATHQRAHSCAVVDREESLLAAERGYLAALSADQPQWAAAMATQYADVVMHDGALDAAEVWLHHAEAALERAGWPVRDHLPYLNVRGNLEIREGEFGRAVKTYEKAIELAERGHQRASLAYSRAVALSEIASTEEALRAFEDAYAQMRDARGLGNRASLTCAVAVSGLHVARGDNDAAEAVLDEAISAARRSLSPQAYTTGRLLEVLALLEYRRDAFEASADAAAEAVQILGARRGEENPATARVRIRHGLALTEAGDPQQAISVLHAAVVSLELAPDETIALAEAWTALSLAKRRVQDPSGAVRDARRAIELLGGANGSDAGSRGDAHHQLALALEASGADETLVRESLEHAVSAFEASVADGYVHTEVLGELRRRLTRPE